MGSIVFVSYFKDSQLYPLSSSILIGLVYSLNGLSLRLIAPLGNHETPKSLSMVYTFKTIHITSACSSISY